jgi:hypothetical protein
VTAPVIDLASRRRPQRTATCACRPDAPCYPHQLEALLTRLRVELLGAEGLLIDRAHLERVVADAETVIDGISSECLAPARVGESNNSNNPHQETK